MRRTQILIDPAHRNWILGGLFSEVSECDPDFFLSPKIISNIKSKFFLLSILNILKIHLQKNPILFSSLTPLENFLKLSKFRSGKKILWFTHQFGEISKKSILILLEADLIFVHSEQEKTFLQKNGVTNPILPLIGAIKPELFNRLSQNGQKIAFIGSATKRKNVEIFLQFAEKNPHLQFKVFGRNWKREDIQTIRENLNNVEYTKIVRQLNCSDLADCSHHLMISAIEGGPISLIESVAAGLIPICTRTGIVETFLSECGYSDQIIDFPIDFDMINLKLKNSYSQDQRVFASKKALAYSIDTFANNLKLHITQNCLMKNH